MGNTFKKSWSKKKLTNNLRLEVNYEHFSEIMDISYILGGFDKLMNVLDEVCYNKQFSSVQHNSKFCSTRTIQNVLSQSVITKTIVD